jgi:hypothetical protein
MKTYADFAALREAQAIKKKCIIMRGIPGAGKSYRAAELLRQLGGTPQGHIFSTDSQFTPVSNKLKFLVHATPETINLNDAIALCQEIVDMWYGAKWNDAKQGGNDGFLEFKKLFDLGQYYEALQLAQQMVGVLDTVEYRSKWEPGKLKWAHGSNLSAFKAAIDRGVTPVIVDNTNTVPREAAAYVRYAAEAGYEISVEEPQSPHWQQHRDLFKDKYGNAKKLDDFAKFLTTKNSHGVPYDSIKKMMDRWHHNMTVDDLMKASEA